jgi:hypothetical protein
MAQHRDQIEQLVEKSSLGDPDARRARARVSDATAAELLGRASTGAVAGRYVSRRSTAGRFVAGRSSTPSTAARSKKFRGTRGTGGS